MTRIDPPLPVLVDGEKALAYAWLDYGVDHDLLWLCAVSATREFWFVPNPRIRAVDNISLGRPPS